MYRKGIRVWLLLAALLLIGPLSSCQTLKKWFLPRPAETHPVLIELVDGDLRFTPDTVPVHTLDFVRWRNPFNGPVTITVDGFTTRPSRQIIPPESVGEVMIRSQLPLGVYKYDVTVVHDGRTYTRDPWFVVVEEGDGDRRPRGDDF